MATYFDMGGYIVNACMRNESILHHMNTQHDSHIAL